MKFQNKIALVTGGSRGIGEAIVFELSAEGADIAFTYLTNKERADDVAGKIRYHDRRCVYL